MEADILGTKKERKKDVEQNEILSRIAQALGQTAKGPYALALSGSLAKGRWDEGSDIDMHLYYSQPEDYDKRRAVIAAIADPGTDFYVAEDVSQFPWGGSTDFTFQGTPVEVTVRTMDQAENVLAQCLEGKIQVYPASWTTNGYYNYIYLAEFGFLRPLDDKTGFIERCKAQCNPYPIRLRSAVVRHFLAQGAMWLGNFHYDSAIRRQDVLFTAGLVQHMVYDLAQAILALGGVYFTGDKHLQEQLAAVEACPKVLLENLPLLLCAKADEKHLLRQKQVLEETVKSLRAQANALREQGELL